MKRSSLMSLQTIGIVVCLSDPGDHGRLLRSRFLLDFRRIAMAGRYQYRRYGRFVLVVSYHGIRHGHFGHRKVYRDD